MKWKKLSNDGDLKKKVLLEVDWDHSFIREISVVSPSYILPDARVVAPDCFPSVRVFISSQSTDISGLELLFVEVEELSVWFAGDLNPDVSISDKIVEWKFGDSMNRPIISKSLYCRFLDNGTWGKELRYAWEDVFDSGGELTIL